MENGSLRQTVNGLLLLLNSNLSVSQVSKELFEIVDIVMP